MAGNALEHGQLARLAGAGAVQVYQVQVGGPKLLEVLRLRQGVGRIGSLAGKVAAGQAHARTVDEVDGGYYIHLNNMKHNFKQLNL
jgi:hypothetical protein